MWGFIFNFSKLLEIGSDAAVYMVMAGVGTLLFLIRLGFALFGGGEGDFDTELEHGVDTDASFTLFSLLSILGFFMGSGWMGLACRVDWGLGAMPSAFIASSTGFVMMLLASGLTYATRKLNKQINYDAGTAVGRTGRVYLAIPEKGKGAGQVEVTISGRRMIMRATSGGPEIAAFTDVTILAAEDDDTLVVETKN